MTPSDAHTTGTQRAPHGEARCSSCGSAVVEIGLLVDDDRLTMLSCTPCDRRTWLRDGWPVPLASIIADVTTSQMRFRRDLAHR